MSKLNDLRDVIHLTARRKGFWDNDRNLGEMLMLVVTELSEAMETHRKDGSIIPISNEIKEAMAEMSDEEFKEHFVLVAKDTFADEMADALIRIMDICGGLHIYIDWHVKNKIRYNTTRERLHGKRY